MLTRAMLDGDAQLPEPIDKSGSLSQIGHRSEYSDLCWGEAIEIGHRMGWNAHQQRLRMGLKIEWGKHEH